jgi:polyhydroxybutyrate depolymerase
MNNDRPCRTSPIWRPVAVFCALSCALGGCVEASGGGGGSAIAPIGQIDAAADAQPSAPDTLATDGDAVAFIDGNSAGGDIGGGKPNGPLSSSGCGKTALHNAGGVQVSIDAGPEGDGKRTFWLSLPTKYEPNKPHTLTVGYAGTNGTGKKTQSYLKLEGGASNEIFVYPDPLWRQFKGWGKFGGWVLGPNANPAHGEGDLIFTEKLLDFIQENYCIDKERVFTTGHSWGGDMAMVAACFLGSRFRAAVPVAANRPYWFKNKSGGATNCNGKPAVWIYFGLGDDHFDSQKYPGQFGDECRDFWLTEYACKPKTVFKIIDLGGSGGSGECVGYQGCGAPLRYCLYGKAAKHQVPKYYSAATKAWFRSF